jgi:hypothetical protein
MTLYQTGESLRLTATIVDTDGAAVDPTTTTISIKKPDGTMAVTDGAMTKSGVGSYYYDYTIASDAGTYSAEVKATGSGGRITLEPDTFIVESAI